MPFLVLYRAFHQTCTDTAHTLVNVLASRINDHVFAGPAMVFAVNDILPGWKFEAGNVRSATFYAATVSLGI
jgi:hypothetical protein